jgi:dynein heavy chain
MVCILLILLFVVYLITDICFQIILLAVKDMNAAKLTADDLPLFNGITSDLFPGTEIPVIDNADLTLAVEAQFLEQGLQV